MCQCSDISNKKAQAIHELKEERARLVKMPVSRRSKNLIERIDEVVHDLQGNEVQYVSECKCEAAFANQVDDTDEITTDPVITDVFNNFSNPIKTIVMNKKVIAGVIIVAAVVLAVVGVKMWRKQSAASPTT